MKVDFFPNPKTLDSVNVKKSSKEAKLACKLLNTAKGKHKTLETVLKYDVTSYNNLYDGNYMTACPQKSELTKELEEIYLNADHYKECIPSNKTLNLSP